MWLLMFVSCLAAALAEPVHIHYPVNVYHGPPAPLGKDGRVVDTPEIAQAKAAHFQAYHEAAARSSHYSYAPSHEHSGSHDHRYHGPPAPLGHDGRVVDTPEVAQSKAAHFQAIQEALSKVSHHPQNDGSHYLYMNK